MAALAKLFEDTLRDIYYAEKQILKALPKMIRKSSSDDLRAGFQKHLEETEGQVERLERAFLLLDKPARGKKCPAIDGILEEGNELLEEHEPGAGLDAAMAGAAQAVEHYEIARYGTLIAWAEVLTYTEVGELLSANLDEEEQCDEDLSALATSRLNQAAADPTSEDDEPQTADKTSEMKPKRKSSKAA